MNHNQRSATAPNQTPVAGVADGAPIVGATVVAVRRLTRTERAKLGLLPSRPFDTDVAVVLSSGAVLLAMSDAEWNDSGHLAVSYQGQFAAVAPSEDIGAEPSARPVSRRVSHRDTHVHPDARTDIPADARRSLRSLFSPIQSLRDSRSHVGLTAEQRAHRLAEAEAAYLVALQVWLDL
jgi:hypothetical protein